MTITATVFAALALALPPAPPEVTLADLDRFPPPSEVRRCLDFSAGHIEFLEQRAITHGWGHGLREWAAEARDLRRTWELLDTAQGHEAVWWYGPQLDALRELRKRLGGPAYLQGCMTAPVPFWRFTRAD